MRYGTVCSGIEAPTVAWHHMGWEPAFFSEIEAFPRAVLEHPHPRVPLHGDFTTIEKNQYGKIDLLVGGTPCQSFSVAGLRGGLGDKRGNLTLEFCRLAQREQPRWVVWENVPGVLSSNGGRDFGSILGALEDLGYGLAYRVLDAQYFGVAQRRRRVFVVGYLGDWRRAAAVLFERKSLRGHPAPSREARQEAARNAAFSTYERVGEPIDATGWPASIAPTLDARFGEKQGLENQHIRNGCGLFVSHTIAIQERAVCENPNAGPDGVGVRSDDAAYTLEARTTAQAVAFAQNTRDEVRCVGGDGKIAGALAAHPGTKQSTYIAFTSKDYGGDAAGQVSPTLRASGHGASHANADAPPAVAFKIGAGSAAGSIGAGEEVAPTLGAAESGTQRSPGLLVNSQVRRLTPVECERLQGFPDNYTAIPWRNKSAENCPDGHRYKALGNSMAVPVMRWIGERIRLVDDFTSLI